jgi:hypothetical protein
MARMIRLAGVAVLQARRTDRPAALALAVSRARSASRIRSPYRQSASWVVLVYMMFSFRSSPPRLAAGHTGDERAGARWTARGKYPSILDRKDKHGVLRALGRPRRRPGRSDTGAVMQLGEQQKSSALVDLMWPGAGR